MSISVADFWRLLIESRLLSVDEARQAAEDLARGRPEAAKDVQQVARGLLNAGKISLFQAKTLLAGRPGPFFYGDYLVYDRVESERLPGLLRARHQPTGHPVCLSFLRGPAADNPQALARLMSHLAVARQAGKAQPRLSGCYEFVNLGSTKFLVVEDLRGNALQARLKPETKLSVAAACRVVRLAALAAAQLHSLGQVHGEVRPANVWIDESGAAKLLQFPLVGDPLSTKAPPASIDAQLDFLAPELANPAALPDARSDVYSLGCLLYTLLTGQPPFPGGDRQNKLARHAGEQPQLAAKLNAQTPAALTQVLAYLLQKEPVKRYADAAAVAEALQAYSGGDPQLSPEPTLPAYENWLERPPMEPAPAAPRPAAAPAVAAPVQPAVAQPAMGPVGAARPAMAVPAQPAHSMQAAAYPANVAAAAPAMPSINVGAPLISPAGDGSSIAHRRARKSGQAAATIGVIVGAVALLGGVVVFLNSQAGQELAPPANASGSAANQQSETTETGPAATKALDAHVADRTGGPKEPIQGIGGPIWQSPTTGDPLDLSWLPPGVQVVLALRPAELSQQAEWQKLVDQRTLGLVSQWLSDDLPKQTGKTLDRLESVLVGLLDGSPGPPKVALVARASEDYSLDDMQTSWSEAKPEEIEGQILHVQSGRAFYLPPSGADKLLVIAPAVDLREMLKTGGEPPPLRREVEVLAESSDSERHLTLLAAPNFPFTDGKALFVEEGAKLIDPLSEFMEMEDTDGKLEMSKAVMFSCHLGDSLFMELRLYDNFGSATSSAAREAQERVAQLPKRLSGYVRDLQLSPYSKPILWDYKDQLDLLHKYTRLGIEGKQIVMRAYLPTQAAHNLALGAHLALLEVPGSGTPVAVATSSAAAKPQTVAERLKKKTTLSFPRNTLEKSLELMGDDIGVQIIILGNDLRDEGITKNQSFGLDEKDQPADEILRKIMKLANPDGKLVYTIKPKEGGGEEVLYVTTRAAAQKRGDKLPAELQK